MHKSNNGVLYLQIPENEEYNEKGSTC